MGKERGCEANLVSRKSARRMGMLSRIRPERSAAARSAGNEYRLVVWVIGKDNSLGSLLGFRFPGASTHVLTKACTLRVTLLGAIARRVLD